MKKGWPEKALMLFGVIAPFAGTLVAIVLLWNRLVTWRDIVLMAAFYVVSGLGVTMGYHRMLTHRSFEARPVLKFLLLVAGSMSVEGPARLWAATHIKHHANTDKEEDPHSPLEGFWHAHMGWFVWGDTTDLKTYGKWMEKDRIVMFVSRTFLVWTVLRFAIPYLIGGWTGLLWGGLVSVFLCHHVTWSVNSVCHVFGRRMFTTADRSTNQWLVGLLAFGEGWHNNHHAFPRSAFHGLRWWQVDISAYLIRGLEAVGLVKNVWRIPAPSFQARLIPPENKEARRLTRLTPAEQAAGTGGRRRRRG